MSSVETGSSPLWRVYEILLKLAERGEKQPDADRPTGQQPTGGTATTGSVAGRSCGETIE